MNNNKIFIRCVNFYNPLNQGNILQSGWGKSRSEIYFDHHFTFFDHLPENWFSLRAYFRLHIIFCWDVRPMQWGTLNMSICSFFLAFNWLLTGFLLIFANIVRFSPSWPDVFIDFLLWRLRKLANCKYYQLNYLFYSAVNSHYIYTGINFQPRIPCEKRRKCNLQLLHVWPVHFRMLTNR